jgi:hypothetical protein
VVHSVGDLERLVKSFRRHLLAENKAKKTVDTYGGGSANCSPRWPGRASCRPPWSARIGTQFDGIGAVGLGSAAGTGNGVLVAEAVTLFARTATDTAAPTINKMTDVAIMTYGRDSGGYDRRSEACHQPGPCHVSLTVAFPFPLSVTVSRMPQDDGKALGITAPRYNSSRSHTDSHYERKRQESGGGASSARIHDDENGVSSTTASHEVVGPGGHIEGASYSEYWKVKTYRAKVKGSFKLRERS